MRRPILHLLVLLLLPLAAAQTYGTPVDAAWFDQVAEAYQDPPADFDGRFFSTTWPYQAQYAPLELDRAINDDGTLTFTPKEGGTCTLLGTASLAERLIRNRVTDLQNVAVGPGAEQFKQRILTTYAAPETIAFESRSFSVRDTPAVVIANGIRYEPTAVDIGPPDNYGLRNYVATFSLAELRQAGAIIDDTLTIATGVLPSARCVFDLTQLP